VDKAAGLIRRDVHLLVIDLFPPGKRDPQGIYEAIWGEFEEEEFALPLDTPLTLLAVDARSRVAYAEFTAVGHALPDMPLFLEADFYVQAPLEPTIDH
jgi:hypothetical protein